MAKLETTWPTKGGKSDASGLTTETGPDLTSTSLSRLRRKKVCIVSLVKEPSRMLYVLEYE